MNSINIIGRLVRDPELKVTNTGKKVARFTVAVDRMIKTQDRSADFFNVQAWEKSAEYVCNYMGKGRLVAVTGRLENQAYGEGDARKDYYVIVASEVRGLDRPRDDAPKTENTPTEDVYDPFAEE